MQGPDYEVACVAVQPDTGMASEVLHGVFGALCGLGSTSGLMLLKEAVLPQDILKLGAGGIN